MSTRQLVTKKWEVDILQHCEESGSAIAEICRIHDEHFPTPMKPEDLQRYFIDDIFRVIAAHSGGKICGFLICQLIDKEAEIICLAVSNSHRSRGFGTRILKCLFNICKFQHIDHIFLEVDVSNRGARSLYRKYNFHEMGVRKNYYKDHKGNRSDALMLRKDL